MTTEPQPQTAGTTRRRLPRLWLEGMVIVGSILFAFAVDAAWDTSQEEAVDRDHLRSVLSDLRATQGLMADASQAHARTQVYAATLLSIPPAEADALSDSILTLMGELLPAYVINAPIGALEAAGVSGAIGRLEDFDLREALTRWPGNIEDLLEEEIVGQDYATGPLMSYLVARVPVGRLFRRIDGLISGGSRRREMPELAPLDEPASADLAGLLSDLEFRNHVVTVLYRARISQNETLYFSAILDEIVDRLAASIEG